MSLIGRGVRRLEDRPLLTGRACFAADVSFPHQLHMRVVRSPIACGRLRGVAVDDAQAAPGVVAVWTAADVQGIPPIEYRQVRVEGLEPYRQPVLAAQRVRYVGEPVALVLATDPYLAEDAADLVTLEIEALEPDLVVTDVPHTFAPGVSNLAATITKGYGDIAAAFEQAHVTIDLELQVGRHTAVPLETRGAIARYDAAQGVLELHGAAKLPHYNRDAIAAMLGLPQSRVQLIGAHVGGGFGVRGELYPEDVLVCLAALRLKRPVKWIEDRNEHLIAANHARDQLHRIRAAVDRQGVVVAIEDIFWVDQGAYVRTHAATVPDLSAAMLPGPYRIPAYRATGHIRLTNKTPAGTYRAPGRYESTFVCERLMDAIAGRLGLDPVEVRRVNMIRAQQMPYKRPLDALGTPVEYDSGDYAMLLGKVLERLDYEALQGALAARRQVGEMVGLGLGLFVEKSGLGPFDGVRIAIDETGTVEVVTGVASVGQGVETVLAQICADTLGVPLEAVRVVHGRTDRIGYGMGAFASRVTVMTGSATHQAAGALRARVLRVAAQLLQASEGELQLEEGMVRAGGGTIPLGEIAKALRPTSPFLAGEGPGLNAEAWFNVGHMTYPYGVHAAVVRVDPETGGVAIERCVVGYDVGRAVNPVLVEGQITGGVAQGLGGALLEELVYDGAGQPLAASLVDYLLPGLAEMPAVQALITEDAPSPVNPLGVKGAGEAGINGMGAAIAAAIDAAIGRPGAITRLPVTPMRLRSLMAGRGG